MAFQWEDREAAAEALGVDLATLDQWISEGRAPTRTVDGRTQVLIEFDPPPPEAPPEAPPEDDALLGDDGPTNEPVPESAPAGDAGSDRVEVREAQPTDQPQQVHLVPAREAQLAAGVAAAWQQLAKQSDEELRRARKVNWIGWAVASVLGVVAVAAVLWLVGEAHEQRTGGAVVQRDLVAAQAELDRLQREGEQLSDQADELGEQRDAARTELARLSERAQALEQQLQRAQTLDDQQRQAAARQLQDLRSLVTTLTAAAVTPAATDDEPVPAATQPAEDDGASPDAETAAFDTAPPATQWATEDDG
jgi:hypothetical protein